MKKALLATYHWLDNNLEKWILVVAFASCAGIIAVEVFRRYILKEQAPSHSGSVVLGKDDARPYVLGPNPGLEGQISRRRIERERIQDEPMRTTPFKMNSVANGARGTFEASRAIIGPESQMAFDIYGTEGSLGWNLEKLNELQLFLAKDDARGYTTVYAGDRYPHHGNFVPVKKSSAAA